MNIYRIAALTERKSRIAYRAMSDKLKAYKAECNRETIKEKYAAAKAAIEEKAE